MPDLLDNAMVCCEAIIANRHPFKSFKIQLMAATYEQLEFLRSEKLENERRDNMSDMSRLLTDPVYALLNLQAEFLIQ